VVVAHSMGGVVVRDALNRCHRQEAGDQGRATDHDREPAGRASGSSERGACTRRHSVVARHESGERLHPRLHRRPLPAVSTTTFSTPTETRERTIPGPATASFRCRGNCAGGPQRGEGRGRVPRESCRVLSSPEAVRRIQQILSEVRSPFPRITCANCTAVDMRSRRADCTRRWRPTWSGRLGDTWMPWSQEPCNRSILAGAFRRGLPWRAIAVSGRNGLAQTRAVVPDRRRRRTRERRAAERARTSNAEFRIPKAETRISKLAYRSPNAGIRIPEPEVRRPKPEESPRNSKPGAKGKCELETAERCRWTA